MKEYFSIQYLRGLAALMVVVFHLGEPLGRMGYTGGWPVGLSAGVDVFFIISGFVMWMTTRDRTVSPLRFWQKRIIRIVPLYWLVTTFMAAVLLIAPSMMQTSVFSLRHVIASYAFLPVENPGKPAMEPLVFPGWTLNYEMFFYLLFGAFLLARPTVRLWGTVAMLVGLVVVGAALAAPKLSVVGFYSSDIMLEFAFGMLLGELVYRREADRLVSPALGWVMLLAGVTAMLVSPRGLSIPRVLLFGVPALTTVAGALSLEGHGKLREYRLAHALGNASYSIYLTQLVSMAAFFMIWRKLHLDRIVATRPLFVLCDVAAALAVGWFCYWLVERRLIALFRGDLRRRMPAVDARA